MKVEAEHPRHDVLDLLVSVACSGGFLLLGITEKTFFLVNFEGDTYSLLEEGVNVGNK